MEKMEKLFQPHLKSAFDELIKGNYKNALIRYLIAAEQGLENAQMSSSYLLYQVQPLLQDRETKTFSEPRIRAAIKYLELASTQKNVDATILLGDIYLNGLEQFEKTASKRFLITKKQHNITHHTDVLGWLICMNMVWEQSTILSITSWPNDTMI